MVATVIKQACQRLAGGLPVHAMFDAVRQTRHQRGAFHQPLSIDNGIVVDGLYGLAKDFSFRFDRRGKPGFAPAANRYRNHPLDGLMP